jgi:hypothetical protein
MAKAFLATNAAFPFFFNVGGIVGLGGTNQAEDVALVSFLMRSAAKGSTTPAATTVLAATKQTSVCTPALIASIKALQAAIGVSQDGRVSVATNPSGSYTGSMQSGAWMICRLSGVVRRGHADVYPRLDKIPNCPPEVAALVMRSLVGSG